MVEEEEKKYSRGVFSGSRSAQIYGPSHFLFFTFFLLSAIAYFVHPGNIHFSSDDFNLEARGHEKVGNLFDSNKSSVFMRTMIFRGIVEIGIIRRSA